MPLLAAILLFIAFVAPGQVARASDADGLFATFVTSRGNFTVLLEHEKTPATVANFLGLAEGTRPWLDTKKGRLERRPFYNGLPFHHVVPGSLIASGSEDGPGYTFGDEFHPALLHDQPGVLSMENSGADTNGSQFFLTLGPAPARDHKHSVFGRVVEGMNVVYEIGSGPAGDTVIERVEISRVGASALEFDSEGAHGLPEWTPARLAWTEDRRLAIDRDPFTAHVFFGSGNIQDWEPLETVTDLAEVGSGLLDVSSFLAAHQKYFFRTTKIQYAHRPADFLGRTLELDFTSSALRLGVTFAADPEAPIPAIFVLNDDPRADVLEASLQHEPASTRLDLVLDGVGSLTFSLKFRTESEGWFTAQGTGATDDEWPLFGTFIVR